jgi:hypothetical protein
LLSSDCLCSRRCFVISFVIFCNLLHHQSWLNSPSAARASYYVSGRLRVFFGRVAWSTSPECSQTRWSSDWFVVLMLCRWVGGCLDMAHAELSYFVSSVILVADFVGKDLILDSFLSWVFVTNSFYNQITAIPPHCKKHMQVGYFHQELSRAANGECSLPYDRQRGRLTCTRTSKYISKSAAWIKQARQYKRMA